MAEKCITVENPLRKSSDNKDFYLTDSPSQFAVLLLGIEMAKVQAVKGEIDGCCQALPISVLLWQE